jgi:hypothetical protein
MYLNSIEEPNVLNLRNFDCDHIFSLKKNPLKMVKKSYDFYGGP